MPNTEVTLEDNSDTFEKIESFSRSIESATNRPTTELNKQLIYKLDWPKRDAIIINLNHYTQMLYGGKTEIALAKDKLKKENANLYQVLLDLPLKSDTDASTGSDHSGKAALALEISTKSLIVTTMLANHGTLFSTESATEESKMKLVEQNNDLVARLAKLQIIMCPVDESFLDGKLA